MNDTQTQIERLIELAIVQRSELKQLVSELPQLREHLNAEIERTFEETEPQIRTELEEFCRARATDEHAKTGAALAAKVEQLSKQLEVTTAAKYSVLMAERAENATLLANAEARIADAAQAIPSQVKAIVNDELSRFPRAGEIDQLRKEFAEPRGLNPRGRWTSGETYNKLDLVSYNGDSFVSSTDGNREKPSRSSEAWTLNAARGNSGGGGGATSLTDLLPIPTSGQIIGSEGNNYVPKALVAGANITITESPTQITIIGTEGQIELQDGSAAAPSLFFVNDTDTGLYRPSANTIGVSVSGTRIAYFDENGLTIPNAGVVAGGSFHAANGNANNPSFSFTSDQDTGIYRHAANQVGVSVSGLASLVFTNNPGELLGHTATSVTFGAGSSGATIALGQGTNGAITITPKGSGNTTLATNLTVSGTGTSSFAGTVNASGTGTHNFGTTNTVTMAAGALTATGRIIAGGDRPFENTNSGKQWQFGASTNGNYYITQVGVGSVQIDHTTGNVALPGNLAVSGTSTASNTMSGALQVGSNVGLSGNAGGASYFGEAATFAGAVNLSTAGTTVSIKSGTNALSGTVTLVGGTATITSTAIDANTVIVMSIKTSGGVVGDHTPSVGVNSGNAVITGSASDTSTYNWIGFKVN